MENIAYLSLGTNINPEENMKAVVTMLARKSKLTAVSSVWETRPVGMVEQPNFLNAAALIETGLTAGRLKTELLSPIEQALGRVRSGDKYGPRPMDIDIIFFNDQILEVKGRHIPDAEVLERPFVAITLAEIAPDYIHPETGQPLHQIATQFSISKEEMWLRPELSQELARLVTAR